MKADLIVKQLIELTLEKKYDEIKNILQLVGYTNKFKGDVFELYIKELYEGNGWLCRRVGGKNDRGADLLLSHPSNPSKVIHIIQVKNYTKPLNFKETRSELVQFEEVASVEYDCSDYRIISLNGYTQSTSEITNIEKLQSFNVSLYDFNDLKSLIDFYDIDRLTIKPSLSLYAHNEVAYKKVLKDWKNNQSTSVIHATGTGKSKIFLKLAGELFYDKKKIILAPSNYILKQFKNDKDNWALNNTTYMTYAKLSRLSKEEIENIEADLVCLDEFHRCGAKVWSQKVKILIESVTKNKNSRILGLTATPIRATADRKNMIDELFNGQSSSSLPVQEAIIKNILPMPKYVSALYTIEQEVEDLIEKVNNSNKPTEEINTLTKTIKNAAINWEKTKGMVEILKKYITFNQGKGIVFCENITHLDEMEETVRRWFKRAGFKVKTYCVHSKNEHSDDELEAFTQASQKNTIHILFGVNALNEGIHFGNDINFTIFLRETASEILYLQQLGRVLQADQGNNPLVFDLVCNFKNINTTSFYDSFADIISETNLLRKSLELSDLKTDAEYIKGFIYDECIEIQEVFSKIRSDLKQDWEFWYNELRELYIKFGDDYLKNISKNKRLTSWINFQRRLKRFNSLSPSKVEKLNEIKFVWEPVESYWEQKYLELKTYYEEFESTDIPQKYEPNPTLGKWVNNQRTLYKKGKLPQHKIDKLNELNFIWDIQEAAWLNYAQRFEAFFKIHKHGNIPQKYKDDPSLGNWVASQRKLKKKGLLSSEKIELLNTMGFIWDLRAFQKIQSSNLISA